MEEAGVLTAIGRQFPGWRPWCSDQGRFYATRTGQARRRPSPHVPAAWAMTVSGDDERELRAELERQAAA